jgi:predicted dehydrogenase
LLSIRFKVVGSEGELRAFNPIAPQIGYASLVLKNGEGTQRQSVTGEATYVCQLRAFKALVEDGVSVPTGGDDAVRNMAVIDAVYRAAGMEPRGSRRSGE